MKIDFKKTLTEYLSGHPFVMVDAGAGGEIKKEWLPLREYMKYVGFEPHPERFQELLNKQTKNSRNIFFNTALWSSKAELSLFLTESEGFSSVYQPNKSVLKNFSENNNRGYSVKTITTIKADKLDKVISPDLQGKIDFIKIDVEGAAKEILLGAQETIADNLILGFLIEAEYIQKYAGQPLFHESDRILQNNGYQLMRQKNCYWKRKYGLQTGGSEGQPVHGDFLYFLDPELFFEKVKDLPPDARTAKIIKYIALTCIYGIYDLSYQLLCEAKSKNYLKDDLIALLDKELQRSKGFFFRIPKLRDRGFVPELFYYFFMLFCGIWLKKYGYWEPKIVLH